MDDGPIQLLTPRSAAKVLGISYSTLTRWALEGRIPFITQPSGHRLYKIPLRTITTKDNDLLRICYCRVSTHKQSQDLNNQVEFLKAKFPNHLFIKDIGSGLNWKRKGLITLLDKVHQGLVQEIVVAHSDRLCRFGFELLQYIFNKHKVKLVVLDQTEKDSMQEFANDVISIITVFNARYYGKRSHSHKIEETQIVSKPRTESHL